jgi:hypothetical protein
MAKFITFLKGVWTFLNSKFFVIILIIVLFIIGIGECKRIIDIKQTVDTNSQNISALTDSLKFERKKNGSLLVSIDGYLATEKELKTLNKGLWDNIQGQTGTIISLNTTIAQLIQDSVQLKKYANKLETKIGNMVEINSTTFVAPWTLAFKYDTVNFDLFTGKTTIGILSTSPLTLKQINTELTKRETQIDLIWGQKIENKKLRVFIQSNYPGFTVKSLEGVLIDPANSPFFKSLMTKKHWFANFGVGPNISYGWNILEAKQAIIIGIGLHYNIYTW